MRFVRLNHSSSRGPMNLYAGLVKEGRLLTDPFQYKTVQLLQDLHEKLIVIPEPAKSRLEYQINNTKMQQKSNLSSPDFAWIKSEETSFLSQVGDWFKRNKTNSNFKLTQTKGLYMYGSVGTGKTMLSKIF